MRLKPFWEIVDYSNKNRFSLNTLLSKIEPHKEEIFKSNNNYMTPTIFKINDLYKTKYPSILIGTQSNYEHIVIDLLGNVFVGTNSTVTGITLKSEFYNKEKIQNKIKEILKCSGK
jgi:hypothetical protein